MVDEDKGWIEQVGCDPATIPWERVKQGLRVMGIHDADDIVTFTIERGDVTINRIRRATRIDTREQVIKVVHG